MFQRLREKIPQRTNTIPREQSLLMPRSPFILPEPIDLRPVSAAPRTLGPFAPPRPNTHHGQVLRRIALSICPTAVLRLIAIEPGYYSSPRLALRQIERTLLAGKPVRDGYIVRAYANEFAAL